MGRERSDNGEWYNSESVLSLGSSPSRSPLRSLFVVNFSQGRRGTRCVVGRNRLRRRAAPLPPSLPPSLTEFVLWLERAFNFRRREARRGEETEERRGKQSRGERERNNTDQLPKGRFMGLFCIWRENSPEGGATDFPCFCMIRQSGLGCPDGGKARSKNELKLSNRLEFRGF